MMKTVILCGGMGTRLSEETALRPKPMVTVGGQPMLWHIMNLYASQGFDEFVLALGYLGPMIKEYFINFHALSSDFSVDLSTGKVDVLRARPSKWKVSLIDTGAETLTGGRLKRLESMLRPQGTFMLTYGDGVADVDLKKLLAFHRAHGKLATVTAVHPSARFGGLELDDTKGSVQRFAEKPKNSEGWINGGFFVFEPGVFDFLDGDKCTLERTPLERLSEAGQLMAYRHGGFWQCMDTLRDRQLLEELWAQKRAPWKIWE